MVGAFGHGGREMSLSIHAGARSLRHRAIVAARRLIDQGGIEALQLRAIAAEVDCGVASLYYHFANKEALLGALAIEGWLDLTEQIEQARASGRFPHQIDAASTALLGFIRRAPKLYALMQTDPALAGHAGVREAEQRAFEAFRAALQHDDRVPSNRVEEVARLFWVLARGIASAVQVEADAVAADRLIQTVLRGFGFLLSPRYAS